MTKKLTTTIFFNYCFDKRRFRNFLQWFFKKNYYGHSQLLQFLEKLKFLGFHSATEAGFSISIEDLKIPDSKSMILLNAENTVLSSDYQILAGNITVIERYQRIIEIWNRTSEKLKSEVLQYFQISNFFNPVYLMAFSGARGNISQIRQLVGMRGLMADHQGQIIDFPIRSNFREGLTLTEYLISCSGARKGIVDTALRTAASGYLTRRLVDVAHHVIISQIDCQQLYLYSNEEKSLKAPNITNNRGIILEDLYDKQKKVLSLQQRLVGRILAETITLSSLGENTENSFFTKETKILGFKNKEISKTISQQICKYKKKILVRSPLTCQSSKFICQLCYGWNLAEGQLVSIGEAVGVLAAQSIGEPGTQLTMRTFHTGGVFTGTLMDQIYAPFVGKIHYCFPCQGVLIRTPQGKIAYLSKNNGTLQLFAVNTHLKKNKSTFKVEPKASPNIEKKYLENKRNKQIKFKFKNKKKVSLLRLDPLNYKGFKWYTNTITIKTPILQNHINILKTNKISEDLYLQFIVNKIHKKNNNYLRKQTLTIMEKILINQKFFNYQLQKFNKKLKKNIYFNPIRKHLNSKLSGTQNFNETKLFNKTAKPRPLLGGNPEGVTSSDLFVLHFISKILVSFVKKKIDKFGFRFSKIETIKPIFENQNDKFLLNFQSLTLLYVRQEEWVTKAQLIAESPYQNLEKSIEKEQEVLSNNAGEIYFENFVFLEKTNLKITKNFIQGLGKFWILFGQSFKHFLISPKIYLVFLKKLDLIDRNVPFSQNIIEPYTFLSEANSPKFDIQFLQTEQLQFFAKKKLFEKSQQHPSQLFLQNSYKNFQIDFIFFKNIGYLQKQELSIKNFLPIYQTKFLKKKIFKNKWTFRKNIKNLLNKNLKTWIIGLKLQTKYIQEYSNYNNQFLKIYIKKFGIQLNKKKFSYINCYGQIGLGSSKYNTNFFFKDPNTDRNLFKFPDVHKKFLCPFQHLQPKLQIWKDNNWLSKKKKKTRKVFSILDHFFLHKKFSLYFVNRQGMIKSFEYSPLHIPITQTKLQKTLLNFLSHPDSLISSKNYKPSFNLKFQKINCLKITTYVKFLEIYQFLPICWGLCSLFFLNNEPFGVLQSKRARVNNRWFQKVNRNLLIGDAFQSNSFSFFGLRALETKSIRTKASSIKYQKDYWFKKQKLTNVEKSNNSTSLGFFCFWLLNFSSSYFLSFSIKLKKYNPSKVNHNTFEKNKSIYTDLINIFLKQSIFIQNVPKNWWRQKNKNKAKIIHWLTLPNQKYFFLLNVLQSLFYNNSKHLFKNPRKTQAEKYQVITSELYFRKNKKNLSKDDIFFLWKSQQRKEILNSKFYGQLRIGLSAFIRILVCFDSLTVNKQFALTNLIKSIKTIENNRLNFQILKNKQLNFHTIYFCELKKKKLLLIDNILIKKIKRIQYGQLWQYYQISQKLNFYNKILFTRKKNAQQQWIRIQQCFPFSGDAFTTKLTKKKKKTQFSNFFINECLITFIFEKTKIVNENKKLAKQEKVYSTNNYKKDDSTKKDIHNLLNFQHLFFFNKKKFKKNFKNIHLNTNINDSPQTQIHLENVSFSHWVFFGDYATKFDKKQNATYFKNFSQQKNSFSENLQLNNKVTKVNFKHNPIIYNSIDRFKNDNQKFYKKTSVINDSFFLLDSFLPQSLIQSTYESNLKNKVHSFKIQKIILDFYFNFWNIILKNYYFIKNCKIRFLQSRPKKPIYNIFIFNLTSNKINNQLSDIVNEKEAIEKYKILTKNLKASSLIKNSKNQKNSKIKSITNSFFNFKHNKKENLSNNIKQHFEVNGTNHLLNLYEIPNVEAKDIQNILRIDSKYNIYIESFSKKSSLSEFCGVNVFTKNDRKVITKYYSTRRFKSPVIQQKLCIRGLVSSNSLQKFKKFWLNKNFINCDRLRFLLIFQQIEFNCPERLCCFRLILNKKNCDNFFSIIPKKFNSSKDFSSDFKQNRKFFRISTLVLNLKLSLEAKKSRNSTLTKNKNTIFFDLQNSNNFSLNSTINEMSEANLLKLNFKTFGMLRKILLLCYFCKTKKKFKMENIKSDKIKILKQITSSSQISNPIIQKKPDVFKFRTNLTDFCIPLFEQTFYKILVNILPIVKCNKFQNTRMLCVVKEKKKKIYIFNIYSIYLNLEKFKLIYKHTYFLNITISQRKFFKMDAYTIKNTNNVTFKIFEKHFLNSHEKQIFIRFFLPYYNCEIVDCLSTKMLDYPKEILLTNISDFFAQSNSCENFLKKKTVPPLKIIYKKYIKPIDTTSLPFGPINASATKNRWSHWSYWPKLKFSLQNTATFLMDIRKFKKHQITTKNDFYKLKKRIPIFNLKQKVNYLDICLAKTVCYLPQILQIFKLNFLHNKNINSVYNGSNLKPSIFILGTFIRGGSIININQIMLFGGQFVAKTQQTILFRKAVTHLLNAPTILYITHGAIISKNQRLCSVFYSQSKTGDIVQGIPKIEEIFEARKKSKYRGLSIFLKEEKSFQAKITKIEKYLQNLQKSVVNNIQRIYCGQGVYISDKHIEIIVRQMTSNVLIIDPGQTGLLCGELVSLQWISQINLTLPSHPIIYEPILIGMTKTCLETSSFLSAASFQETTRILSRAALQNQVDFLRGLKQNVILGNLIPIGTGCF
uniref:DNA-directed RNA polymerase n=1 Tax=Pseudochlorodesmis sp. HV01306c TaxID=2358490 RepID=A0A386AYD4_9CHLO|nr:RNA polymerase b-subunit [Pseudochlorodesmis sp. HV01306c]